jgi:hypothetical protein
MCYPALIANRALNVFFFFKQAGGKGAYNRRECDVYASFRLKFDQSPTRPHTHYTRYYLYTHTSISVTAINNVILINKRGLTKK